MVAISASAVKELRQRTGAGMMDCKKALVEADGNMDEAIKVLRTKGLAAAAKKAHRTASDGLVVVAGEDRGAALLELNCETDFVARNDEFQKFADTLAEQALSQGIGDVEALKGKPFAADPQHTVEEAVSQKIATIGENIVLSRLALLEAAPQNHLAWYIHMGGKIGVVVEGSESIPREALRDVAMHVAATDPRFVRREEVTDEVLQTEREIALKQAIDQGKPEHIAERIVQGKMEKYFEQCVLLEQPFAKDTLKTVGDFVVEAGGKDATIARFARFRLGEAAGE
ncbi:MAG: translation elongation factor Ts [Acidobacteria bacterium]|jgi:elongation factor Ts|nr:translation elongation factor Ts [Acidobacteriota bacterium]